MACTLGCSDQIDIIAISLVSQDAVSAIQFCNRYGET